MTDKQEKILEAALVLFAQEGYNATSTSKIAQKAGVSEGLIFRHFKNKKGLLNALMKQAEEMFKSLLIDILFETNPKAVIRKTIELPFNIDKSEYDYWRLQFKLKFETAYNNPEKTKLLLDKLTLAFQELGYKKPQHEAKVIGLLLDALAIELLKGNMDRNSEIKTFLIEKYEL